MTQTAIAARRIDIQPLQVLGSVPFSVLAIEEDSTILFVNSAAEQFFEQGATGLTGRKLNALLPPHSPIFSLAQQALTGRTSITEYDVSIAYPIGHLRNLVVTAAPLADDPSIVVLSFHEQSIARRINSQLVHRNAARSVTGLAALLAHEVKNPLSGIRGAAQLLESGLKNDADQELTRLICEETDRICELVDRMGLFTDGPFNRSAVNIHQVLERVRKVAKAGFGRHVEIVEEYDPSLPPVYGNADQLIQVLLNVVKNACEAVPRNAGVIRLRTSYQHGIRLALPGGAHRVQLPLMVSVIDNGPGIPEDVTANLFDPFVTSKTEGSGLGLALVAKVIGDHGGIVEFDSSENGTEFRLRLPMHDGAAADYGHLPNEE